MNTALAFLATTTSDGPSLDSQGVITWVATNLLPLLFLGLGLAIIAAARGGRLSDNANTLTNAGLGCALIVGGGALYLFAGDLVGLAFPGAG